MIPEEEARKLRLPGSDTFLRTELAYRDEINKGALVTFLNREAYKAFTDSMMPPELWLLRTLRAMSTIVQNFFVGDWLSKRVKKSQPTIIAQFST